MRGGNAGGNIMNEILGTSIFKRSPRKKLTNRLDETGEPLKVKVRGGWVYRIRLIQEGQPKTIEKGFWDLKNQAKEKLKRHLHELETRAESQIKKGSKMTFNDLATVCLDPNDEDCLYPPGSIRSMQSLDAYVLNLKKFFGKQLIGNITKKNLRAYLLHRTSQTRPTKDGEEPRFITTATANRELATLRVMLFHAISCGWLVTNPFFKARVISTKNEVARDRILSLDEITRLLAACTGEHNVPYTRKWKGKTQKLSLKREFNNVHLRAMIILSIDAGLRRGEILKLRWKDIDFERMRLTIRPETSKTGRGRIMPLTDRSITELRQIKALSESDRPFPYTDVKRSFATAKRVSGLTDIRFHDLRRTHVSIRASRGENALAVGKSVGHSQLQTTMRHYVAIDERELEDLRIRLNSYNVESAKLQGVIGANELTN